MPVVDDPVHLNDSSRSSPTTTVQDDQGSSTLDKRQVSFNNDVKIRKIPLKAKVSQESNTNPRIVPEKFEKFTKEQINPADVEAQTQAILDQLEGIECSVSNLPSTVVNNTNPAKIQDNRLYGLHALNNLDIAVNGKEVNSMPSYQEIRLRSRPQHQNYSDTPPKPPRKAPSQSPPSVRRGMTHYAQPAISGLYSDLESVASDNRKIRPENPNEDSAIASGDADDSTVTSSYTSRFIRKSPPRQRMSPSRTCMTDSEILRSPTEVLYAVSDKHKHRNNELMTNTSSQTMHSNPPRTYARPRSAYNYSSREDLSSNHESYRHRSTSDNHRYKRNPPVKNHHNSRSLDRLQPMEQDYIDGGHDRHPERRSHHGSGGGKENSTFKTRIQVISPESQHMIQNGSSSRDHSRKPFKTTINTATDNILYRGNSTDNLSFYHYGDTGHYKIPKTRPVKNYNDGSPYRNSLQRPHHPNNFTSTRLIKNIENNRGRNFMERNMILRNRNSSGHSTSPDRDGSPDRYGNRQPRAPPRSYIHQRSPSTSPSRPPRSRSSPTRESNGVVRRVSTRRTEVDRSPMSRSRENSGQRRSSYAPPENDRLSKFTEYRGEDIIMPHAQDPNQSPRRADRQAEERARGQSLPPGATKENLRDFYKSSQQYKSMYALPPSPTRPAPVLDRGVANGNTATIHRPRLSPSAGPRVSISEGDVTDESGRPIGQPPPEKMPRHHRRPVSASALRPSKRQAPSPPVAPSTGKGLVVRRVVSSDGRATRVVNNSNVQQAPPSVRRIVVGNGGRRSSIDNGLDSSFSESEGFNGENENQPRPWSSLSDDDLEDEIEYVLAVTNGIVNGHQSQVDPNDLEIDDYDQHDHHGRALSGILAPSVISSRPSTSATIVHVHSQPPIKIMPSVHRDPSMKRVQSNNQVVFHENPTSYHNVIKDKQPASALGEFGRRWHATTISDIDSDYRRELATSSVGLHQEARSRDGGLSWAGQGRLSRGSSKTNVRSEAEPELILRSPSTTELERSNSSTREEERRKILELEGVIRQPAPIRTGVSRSASRASRTAHVTNAGPRGYKPGVPRHLSAEIDRESQYSGHSSSQTAPLPGPTAKLNRFDQHRVGVGRVRRSTSNANAAAMGGVRREINQRKTKLPGGSLTSSINSSESEQGSQSAVSRNTARSNRSVFLHAAAVADIPSPDGPVSKPAPPPTQQQQRSLSAESRDNLAVSSGAISAQTKPPPPSNGLKGSKKISRSISLLAPWKPKTVQNRFEHEIHYDNGNLYANPATRVTVEPGNLPAPAAKPPRPPTAPPPPPVTSPPRRNAVHRSDSKSASSADLLRDQDTTPAVILAERKAAANAANSSASGAETKSKVSRSVSMPKDSRLAGWFKKRKRIA